MLNKWFLLSYKNPCILLFLLLSFTPCSPRLLPPTQRNKITFNDVTFYVDHSWRLQTGEYNLWQPLIFTQTMWKEKRGQMVLLTSRKLCIKYHTFSSFSLMPLIYHMLILQFHKIVCDQALMQWQSCKIRKVSVLALLCKSSIAILSSLVPQTVHYSNIALTISEDKKKGTI